MKDKTCIITGGTSGVGRATAIGLAQLGAKVYIISSNKERGLAVVKDIISKTGNKNIEYRVVDLASFDSIRQFVHEFEKENRSLHVLSNNAAVFPSKKEYSTDGIEKIFAVNFLGHFLLSLLLVNLLKNGAPSRLVTVSGDPLAIRFGQIDINDLNIDKKYNPFKATLRAAFAKVLFSFEFAKRYKEYGISSNTFHPGLVKSNLTRHFPRPIKFFADIGQIFFSETCKTSVYLASSPQVEGVTGKFFVNSKIVDFHPKQNVDVILPLLWEKSAKLTGLNQELE